MLRRGASFELFLATPPDAGRWTIPKVDSPSVVVMSASYDAFGALAVELNAAATGRAVITSWKPPGPLDSDPAGWAVIIVVVADTRVVRRTPN